MNQLSNTMTSPKNPQGFEVQRLARRGLRIQRTSVGKGLFATKRIVDGSCVGEIEGEIIIDDTYVSRYCFDFEDGTQLEPAAPFRFVNHSCEPNCAFQVFSFPRSDSSIQSTNADAPAAVRKLLLFAICDIYVGEELTIDYNWPADFAIRCQCRTPSCRGWVVNPKHLAMLNSPQ